MKCGQCEQEMMDDEAVSCTDQKIKFPDGTELAPVPSCELERGDGDGD